MFNERTAHAAEGTINSALSTYLSTLIGIHPASEDIQQYVAALRSEGCDVPADFDELVLTLEIDELGGAPFHFKRFHLTKVCTHMGICVVLSIRRYGL